MLKKIKLGITIFLVFTFTFFLVKFLLFLSPLIQMQYLCLYI